MNRRSCLSTPWACLLVTFVSLTTASASMPSPFAWSSSAVEPPPKFLPTDSRTLDSDIASRLEAMRAIRGPWAWSDLLERGRLAVAAGDLPAACSAFEMATQSASSDEQRVIAQYYWGTSLLASAQAIPTAPTGFIDQIGGILSEPEPSNPRRTQLTRLAGTVLNDAQQMSPYSRDIAASRVLAWSMLDDELETLAAEHQLRVIDPAMEGSARNKFTTVTKIVLAICRAGRVILLNIDLDRLINPEQRVALLEWMDAGATAAEISLTLTSQGDR